MTNTNLLKIELNEKPFTVDYKENLAIAYKMLEEIRMDLCKETHEELMQELARIDAMQQDVLHIIELMNFNAVEGYKFSKMLQIIRIARRKIKNRLEERTAMKNLMKSYGNIRQQIGAVLNNVETLPVRQSSRSYRLRELKELEGFNKVIEEQKKKMKIS